MREHDTVKLYKVIMVCLLPSPKWPYNFYCRIFLNSWEHECHTALDMSILMGTHCVTVTKHQEMFAEMFAAHLLRAMDGDQVAKLPSVAS